MKKEAEIASRLKNSRSQRRTACLSEEDRIQGNDPAGGSEPPTFEPRSVDEWRRWLEENGRAEKCVHLVLYHKDSGVPSLAYRDAIEHALCFGWVDSRAMKRDARSFILRFTPRNPGSTWSSINRERAGRMTARGYMTPAGQALIDLARESGTWDALAPAADGEVPPGLLADFAANPAALQNFQGFTKSKRRSILEWILIAKRPETRRKRIERVLELASQHRTPFD